MLIHLVFYLLTVTSSTFSSPQTTVSNHYFKQVSSVTPGSFTIGEVVVTARRVLPSTRLYIRKQDIEEKGAISLEKISNLTPVINTQQTSRGDTYIYLSGFNHKEIQIYLDGIPVYIPYNGDIGADILKLINVEKIVIEPVLPSLFYGPNAMGGAVNILSASPEEGLHGKGVAEISSSWGKSFKLILGDRSGHLYGGASTYLWKDPGFILSKKFHSSLNENGGLRENSYSNGYSFFGYTGYQDEEDFLTVRYYKTSMEKGVPPEVNSTRPRYWKFTDWEKDFLNLVGKKHFKKFLLRFNSAYTGYYNVLDSYDNSYYTTQTRRYAFHSTYDDYTLLDTLTGSMSIGEASISTMLLYRKDIHREQSDYNKEWEKYGQELYSTAVRATFQHKKLIFLTEGRYDYLAAFKYHNSQATNYRFGTRYLTDSGKIDIIFGSTTRFPTMKEKYSHHHGKSIPNPDLKPESQTAVVLKYQNDFSNHFLLTTYAFYSRIRNLIQSKYVDENITQNQNIAKAEIEGFYVFAEYFQSNMNISGSLTGTWAKDLTNNLHLPYRPRWKINISGDYSIWKIKINCGINGEFINFYQDEKNGEIKKLPSWYTVDMGSEFNFSSNFSAYFRVENVFDRNYETEQGFPAPGRMIYAGIRGKF